MNETLKKFLESQGISATHCHSSDGSQILQLPNELSLMIMVEVYDQQDGSHETVPLNELVRTITEWRD